MKDKQLNKLIKLRDEVEKIGEDKLSAILFRGILQHLVGKLLDFDIYLLKTKNKAHKKFREAIDIIHDHEHLL